jgi:hypothetical protein
MSDQQQQPNIIQTPDYFNERLPGETPKAFEAFKIYRDLPTQERTLAAAYTFYLRRGKGKDKGEIRATPAPAGWEAWSSKFQWVARSAASDRYRDARRQAVREQLEREDEEQLHARRKQVQERAWRTAEALSKRVDEMLKHPLLEQRVDREVTDDQGRVIQQTLIIKPARWGMFTAIQAAEMADKLARLATGMSTDHVTISAEYREQLRQIKKEYDEAGIDYAKEYPDILEIFRRAGLL